MVTKKISLLNMGIVMSVISGAKYAEFKKRSTRIPLLKDIFGFVIDVEKYIIINLDMHELAEKLLKKLDILIVELSLSKINPTCLLAQRDRLLRQVPINKEAEKYPEDKDLQFKKKKDRFEDWLEIMSAPPSWTTTAVPTIGHDELERLARQLEEQRSNGSYGRPALNPHELERLASQQERIYRMRQLEEQRSMGSQLDPRYGLQPGTGYNGSATGAFYNGSTTT
jgi:hypothetical protein